MDLPSGGSVAKLKPKRGWIPPPPKRNNTDFSNVQIKKLTSIRKKFIAEKKIMPDYDQELVFKINTIKNIPAEQFQTQLNRIGLDTLLTKSKNTEWLVITNESKSFQFDEKIIKSSTTTKPDFIDMIETIDDVDITYKLGQLLIKNPLTPIEISNLHVNLTRKENDSNSQKIDSTIKYIRKLAELQGFKVHDELRTENLILLLVECNLELLEKIGMLDLVIMIDRTPEFMLEQTILEGDYVDLDVDPPPSDAPGILVMDTGIIRHPLLEPAIRDGGIVGLSPLNDDLGHGTRVSGNALYGNLESRIHTKTFDAKFWIYSAKILYERIDPPTTKLLHSIVKDSLYTIKKKFPNCRLVNLSVGIPSHIMNQNISQFDFAILIDDLSITYDDVIFVISIGNTDPDLSNFPNYLCSDMVDIKLTDPASSIHALSIGGLQELPDRLIPSNITRLGPGLNDMIKPELVEISGGRYKSTIVLNSDFRQRTFTKGTGTSYSAPIITNYLAELLAKYPNYSRNLIISLLLSSSEYPKPFPESFPQLNNDINKENFLKISNVYGYGRPNLNNALHSDENRVVFKYDGSIPVDHVLYFKIKIPSEFTDVRGKRFISVSLVFDPPIKSTRSDYFGTRMEFHMFRNLPFDTVKNNFDDDNHDTITQSTVDLNYFNNCKIKFTPGSRTRSKTPHQKGIAVLHSGTHLDSSMPLVLVITCKKKWKNIDEQKFAIVVTLKHDEDIGLYDKIRILNNPDKSISRAHA